MTTIFKTIAVSFMIGAASAIGPASVTGGESSGVGVTGFTFDSALHSLPVHSVIWYPAAGGGRRELIGDDAVFEGTPVLRNAAPSSRRHPLILLSHGSGGSAAFEGWIAGRLAEAGYVVATPNHPGSTSGDSRPETTIRVWERMQDLSALLDAIQRSPSLQQFVDLTDVTVMGFSLGGHTALAMAGARVSAPAYARYCDDHADAMDCIWYDRGNQQIPGHVDLHRIDASLFDAGYADRRVKRVIAVDPSLAQAVTSESLSEMKVPVLLINLGEDGAIPIGVDASNIARAIPHAVYKTISGANHFSFLPTCKSVSWLWLMLEGDDPVCDEAGGRSRDDVHEDIASHVLTFLNGTRM